jgi:hypothetical protein
MNVAASDGGAARLDPARRRVAAVKRVLAAAALAGFAVTIGLARASHPGVASSTGSDQAGSSSSSVSVGDDGFGFGSASIAPSVGGSAQFQTHAS